MKLIFLVYFTEKENFMPTFKCLPQTGKSQEKYFLCKHHETTYCLLLTCLLIVISKKHPNKFKSFTLFIQVKDKKKYTMVIEGAATAFENIFHYFVDCFLVVFKWRSSNKVSRLDILTYFLSRMTFLSQSARQWRSKYQPRSLYQFWFLVVPKYEKNKVEV